MDPWYLLLRLTLTAGSHCRALARAVQESLPDDIRSTGEVLAARVEWTAAVLDSRTMNPDKPPDTQQPPETGTQDPPHTPAP